MARQAGSSDSQVNHVAKGVFWPRGFKKERYGLLEGFAHAARERKFNELDAYLSRCCGDEKDAPGLASLVGHPRACLAASTEVVDNAKMMDEGDTVSHSAAKEDPSSELEGDCGEFLLWTRPQASPRSSKSDLIKECTEPEPELESSAVCPQHAKSEADPESSTSSASSPSASSSKTNLYEPPAQDGVAAEVHHAVDKHGNPILWNIQDAEDDALRNYELFYQLPTGTATLEDADSEDSESSCSTSSESDLDSDSSSGSSSSSSVSSVSSLDLDDSVINGLEAVNADNNEEDEEDDEKETQEVTDPISLKHQSEIQKPFLMPAHAPLGLLECIPEDADEDTTELDLASEEDA